MEEREQRICPYCQFPISPSDRVVICPGCETAHHAECWEQNGGCTRYGCPYSPEARGRVETPPPVEPFPEPAACHVCGAPLPPEANFCPRCGARVGLGRVPIRARGSPNSWADACCGCLIGLLILLFILILLGGGCPLSH